MMSDFFSKLYDFLDRLFNRSGKNSTFNGDFK